MKVTVGIPAYNEEANIGKILEAILSQELVKGISISEIIVAADGCTDRTVEIVKEYQQKNNLIKLLYQDKRLGLTFAVNNILKNAKGDILIMTCADTIPTKKVVSYLVSPFFNEKNIGAVVGRAVPVNDPNTMWSYIGHLFFKWNYSPDFLMVDFEAMTAMRKDLLEPIPPNTGISNERYLHKVITDKGFKVIHAPNAIVYSKFPDNLKDFISQRRRNLFRHMQMKRLGMDVPHISPAKGAMVVLKSLTLNPKKMFWLNVAVLLTFYCYILAWLDNIMGKSHAKWEMTESTKKVE